MQEYLDHLQLKRRSGTVLELQVRASHAESVRQHIKTLRNDLVNLGEIEVLRRDELNRTMRDEKVLDKLRDKKLSEYNHDVLSEEQAQMDEIAMRADAPFDE